MAYTYKYIPSSFGASAQKGNAPKNQYTDLFQRTLNEQFYNSTNWWTIEEETYVGSAEYADMDVRIAHVINAETGLKLGDDWKTLLFKERDHEAELGKQYRFDDNTWLTINTEIIKNLTATCTIRRCNNTLRWIDEATGKYYEEPCCIEYLVKEPRDYATQGSPFITPGGFLHIEMQFNDRSNLIKENQRFLFGNPNHWTCYKVIGTGINDFRNITTYDNQSARILTLDLVANMVNPELDDIVNGLADVYTNLYVVTLSSASAQANVGDTLWLTSSTTYNGDSVEREMEWTSSDSRIATVSGSSGSALVTMIALGSCHITANVALNSASAACLITVTGSPIVNNEILISPDINYVLEGKSRNYAVYLYENNIQQADTFTITCTGSDVSATSYTFTQTDGNHFTLINNLRDINSYLTIHCVSGSVIPEKTYKIYLRGAWQYDNA